MKSPAISQLIPAEKESHLLACTISGICSPFRPTSRLLLAFGQVIFLLAWLADRLGSNGSRSGMLRRGTGPLGSDALPSGLTWDVEDVCVLQRCLAAAL